MNLCETPLTFQCHGEQLVGILHHPINPITRGLVIIVGGPQYRVGSHRQFTLLARDLARNRVPVIRFDYRGMGDSEGQGVTFEEIGPDIEAAIDILLSHFPSLKEVILWGLCDAASGALLYAYQDTRVTGLVLLNPWVRTESGLAKTYLRNYYTAKIINLNVWRDVLAGNINIKKAARSLVRNVTLALGLRGNKGLLGKNRQESEACPERSTIVCGASYVIRMFMGLQKFKGNVLFILSGNDLTAAEFKNTVTFSRHWRRLLNQSNISIYEIPEANHTFSKREWRDQVSEWTLEWIKTP